MKQHVAAVVVVASVLAVACVAPALGQSGSRTWAGGVSSDFYDGANWSPSGDFPNGNVTFSGSPTYTTVDRSSGTYNYVFGLYFNNTSSAQPAFTINGPVKFFVGGSVIRTANMVSGSLTDVINADIQKAGTAEVFDMGTDHHLTVNGVVYGGNPLTKTGAGTLTFSGANTYTGNTIVNDGTLKVSNSSTTPSYDIASGAILEISADPAVSMAVTGAGRLNITGTVWANAIGWTTMMDSGAYIDIKSGHGLYFNAGGDPWTGNLADLNVDGTVRGAGNSIEVDSLTGNGSVTMSGGTVIVGVDSGGGTFNGNFGTSYGQDGHFRKEGNGTQILTGSVNLDHNDDGGSTVTVNGTGVLRLGDGGTGGSIEPASTISIGAGATFSISQSDAVIQGTDLSSSAISGAGSFEQKGTGTTTLNVNNTYSGGTTVDGGTLKLTDDGRIGGGGLTVNTGGTFSVANEDFNTVPGTITINAGGTLSTDSPTTGNAHNIGALFLNGGTLTSSGAAWSEGNWVFNDDVTVGGSTLSTISGLQVGSKSGGGTYNVADSVAGAGTDLLVSAKMVDASGGSFLIKTGAGTMELTAQNTYSGGTTVSNGVLELSGGANRISGAVVVDGVGTVKVSNAAHNNINSITSITLQNGGTLTDNSGGTYVQSANMPVTFSNGGTITSEPGTPGNAGFGNFLFAGGINVTGTGLATINANGIGFNFDETVTVADTVAGPGTDLLISSSIRPNREGTVTKAGPGTLTLTGVNTDTSPFAIAAGTLEIGGAGQLNSGAYAGNITNDGSFVYNSSAAQTMSGLISGTGTLTKDSSGTLTLSGANTYSGNTTINAGILKIGHTSALGAAAQGTVVADSATLEFGHSGGISEPVTISGAGVGGIGAIYSTGANADMGSTLTLATDASIGGTTRIDHWGQITDGGSGYTLTKTGTFDFLPSGAANYSHLVIDQGTVTLTGNSALPASPGTVTVNPGTTLTLWAGRTIGSTDITFSNSTFSAAQNVPNTQSIDGTMDLNGNVTFQSWNIANTVNSTVGGSGNLALKSVNADGGKFIFTGANNYSGTTTVGDGVRPFTLQLGNGGTGGSLNTASAISVASGSTFAVNQSDAVTQGTDFSGAALSGAGGFAQEGAGTTTLNAANTYTGPTAVNAGVLAVTHNNALGTAAGNTVVADNAKLNLNGSSGDLTIAEPLTLGGGGGVLRNLSGDNTLTGPITLSNNADFRRNAGTLTISGGITGVNKGLSLNGPFIITDNPISLGSGGVTFTSNGSVPTEINVGGNTWTGVSRINFSGNVKLGLNNALPTDVDLEFGWHVQASSAGTLDLNGHNQTVGSIAVASPFPDMGGDQNITGGGSLTVNQASGTREYQGRITDGGTATSLTKSGGGTLILNNLSGTPSSYTGTTTVNGGVLQAGDANAFGSNSAVTVGGAGTLRLAGNSVALGSLAGAGIVENAGPVGTILQDDFSSGSIITTFRVYENLIDDGWLKQFINTSEWTISGGRMENAATNTASGYSANGPAEAPVSQIWSNPDPDNASGQLVLSFDYGVGSGDSFYAHLWGVLGTSDDDTEFISNIEAGVNGAIDGGGGNSVELTEYNLKDGSGAGDKGTTANAISGLLTGTGSFTATVDIVSLGIPGVTSVGDFDYFYVAFAKDEDGTAGTTWIDDLTVSAGAAILTAGADNTSTAFSGTIQDGAGSGALGLTKTGTGALTLAGNNTYRDTTTVDEGTLLVNNTTGSGTGTGVVNVNSNATLGGTGSIAGLVSVGNSGHIAPGSSVGTITLGGGLTLDNGSILHFELATPGASDQILVTGGTLTGSDAGGVTLNATFTGPAHGGTYTLMDWSAATGSGVELEDFNLVFTAPDGALHELLVANEKLLLNVQVSTVFTFR